MTIANYLMPLTKVCPKAPGDAQKYVDDVQGNVQWGVLICLAIAAVVGIGAIVCGRIFSMPHASKGGVITIVVVFFAAIGYMVVPGIISGITGSGCV
ncbi:hypothetical protein IFT73_00790 [Aeromicrobium sp. CFBP 8757]|uniref:hypothetical protein n=1 Tax=Aeromicrobium sp. CFBP 8757 TaxID=2775288 RepID=UPI001784FBB4|nr:hypothetical protein [Aeromicrobium sp. CFBP 8757]MBD8605374.1 hypothetical protein [Aeromicrobium sp. CFBP 8757]